MINYCGYSKNHKCLKWADYEQTRFELEEADEICHANMIEIDQKDHYIEIIQNLLTQNGIPFPIA